MKSLFPKLGLVFALCVGVVTSTAHADQPNGARSARTNRASIDTSQLSRRGENLAIRVAARLDAARRERDRMRTNCLDSTLSEVHAALRIIKHESDRQMSPGRGRVLSRVWTARLVELDAQAMACERNNGIDVSGQTRVITTIDPSTPNIDPTVLPRDRHHDFHGDRR